MGCPVLPFLDNVGTFCGGSMEGMEWGMGVGLLMIPPDPVPIWLILGSEAEVIYADCILVSQISMESILLMKSSLTLF